MVVQFCRFEDDNDIRLVYFVCCGIGPVTMITVKMVVSHFLANLLQLKRNSTCIPSGPEAFPVLASLSADLNSSAESEPE